MTVLTICLVTLVVGVRGDLPLSWPRGTYGLPMPIEGCPNSRFKWREGTRYQDTDDSNPGNAFPDKFRLAGDKDKSFLEHKFCIKTEFRPLLDVEVEDDAFPGGQYCIYKKYRCPTGFKTGYIKWDDEDGNNGNSYSGTLPDGTYDQDTVIFFCCRDDGPTYRHIPLPTDDPFVLFPTDEECQEVQGMTSELQWYKWDTENRGNADKFVGSLPFHVGNPDIQLAFCVYTKQSV